MITLALVASPPLSACSWHPSDPCMDLPGMVSIESLLLGAAGSSGQTMHRWWPVVARPCIYLACHRLQQPESIKCHCGWAAKEWEVGLRLCRCARSKPFLFSLWQSPASQICVPKLVAQFQVDPLAQFGTATAPILYWIPCSHIGLSIPVLDRIALSVMLCLTHNRFLFQWQLILI